MSSGITGKQKTQTNHEDSYEQKEKKRRAI